MLAFLRLFEEEGEAAAEAANPILPVFSEMFWGAIAFGLLFVLVRFVLLPPVRAAMDGRAAKIRGDLDAAETARDRAGSAATEVQDQLAGVRAEATEIVDAARTEADTARAGVIAEADAEAAGIRSGVADEIATARAEALEGIKPQVAELATAAASRVMNRQIALGDAQPVVDQFLANPN